MDNSAEAPVGAASQKRRWGDLGVRAVSGAVLVAIAIWTARHGGAIFVVAWLINAIVVFWEWQRLVGGAAPRLRLWVGAGALVFAAAIARFDAAQALFLLLLAAAAQAALAGRGARAWAAGGMVYAGLLIVAVTSLRFSFPYGSRALIWLFATVWSTDVFAYFGGRLIGGPKLWPRISPSKTWSGTLTGLVAGSLIGTFAALRDLSAPTAMTPVFLLSLSAAVLSQAGDAFESAVKRHFEVKDSSGLIPGHGGLMDRLDGFIAAAIFAFLFGLLRGLPSVAGGLFYWA